MYNGIQVFDSLKNVVKKDFYKIKFQNKFSCYIQSYFVLFTLSNRLEQNNKLIRLKAGCEKFVKTL